MKKLINNIYQLKSYEKIIILLGFMGLIPFIVGLLDLWFNQENLIFPINIPKNYGVIILTFLGSVYWGIILNQNKMNAFTNQFKIFMLIWSIIPALLGIVTLLIDKRISLIILSLEYLICQLVDEFYNKILLFPNWYIFLRRSLSITVITILICSYFILKY